MTYETIEYKDHEIKIYRDECPPNPYDDCDMAGTLTLAKQYHHLARTAEHSSHSDLHDLLRSIQSYDHPCVIIPVYCNGDKVGYMRIDDKKRVYEWGDSSDSYAKAKAYLENEVKTLNDYWNGDVFGYVVEDLPVDSFNDSCWGYYGEYGSSGYKYMVKEAQSAIDRYLEYASAHHYGVACTL